jgi:hypothetical protein
VYVYDKHEKDELDAGERRAVHDYIQREKRALDRRQVI